MTAGVTGATKQESEDANQSNQGGSNQATCKDTGVGGLCVGALI